MKRILSAVLVLAFAVSCGWSLSIVPKIGFDVPASVRGDNGFAAYDVYGGGNIGIEARVGISKYFMWSAGFEYDFSRHLIDTGKSWNESDFSFSPLYVALFWAPLSQWGDVKPYLKVFVGYNVLASVASEVAESAEGSVNWGGGLGFEYKSLVFEFTGSSSNGKFKTASTTQEIEYRKITLSAGYKFQI
ncbi:outer membrane beta-barrel protein [Endomicrobium proavitum]|uniref:Outer membrane protein beta-barrel domain-containing protein n=1 Tax=Endomicrobium proavitum TaxID=1408281 RepID=A0A0G3WMK2_9BACT|nr:outer membrane beta-barrel protein [Endomicrobium proavitum]AKL98719.1 exported protein of unknown function [Endomicrobium proavitum]